MPNPDSTQRPSDVPEGATDRLARMLAIGRPVPAVVVFVLGVADVWRASVRASWATLGRDQGIFQYVAWAVMQGERAYRDVRDVNGPLVLLVHRAMLALGGADEHRFRVLDLALAGASFVVVGACLPALVVRSTRVSSFAAKSLHPAPNGASRPRGRAVLAERASWAAAAWAVLSAQYLAAGYWDTAQRESFFDAFLLVSLGLELEALAVLRSVGASRRARVFLALSGAASAMPWFGKPTYALATVAQLVVLLVDDVGAAFGRRARLVTFASGATVSVVLMVALLVVIGDPVAYARISFVDVPAMYRFIWPRTVGELLALPGYLRTTVEALAAAGAVVLLVAVGTMPRRALLLAIMPLFGLVSVVVQAKGFPYHFHPVTIGTSLAYLGLVAFAGGGGVEGRRWLRAGAALAAIAGAAVLGLRAGIFAGRAPFPPPPDDAIRDEAARLAPFERVDFFPYDLRLAAAYLAEHTAPNARVQTYAMDPYLLFLARRRSATPYIYAYDLNADAALAGSYEPDGLHPTAAQAERIRAMRDEHERDLRARLERDPPAAFVFVGRSPLMTHVDALEDFQVHCPTTWRWLAPRYREAVTFGTLRIWLRHDTAADAASP